MVTIKQRKSDARGFDLPMNKPLCLSVWSGAMALTMEEVLLPGGRIRTCHMVSCHLVKTDELDFLHQL